MASSSSLDNRSVPALGMTGADFRSAALSTINAIEEYYTNLPSTPVLPDIEPGYLQKLLPTSAPQNGESWDAIKADIGRVIMPGITHWQSPRFMAFFAASSTYPAILGEMWSAALTGPAFNWICSPATTELETIVLDWLAAILGLPETFFSKGEGGGVIQGSASEAVATVMVAARERFVRRQLAREGFSIERSDLSATAKEEIEDRECAIRSTLVAMASDQTHSSTHKAAKIAGTRFRSIRTHSEDDYALTGDHLRAKIEELKARGLNPYFLTVCLGATGTCAVDDFESIFAVAADYPDVWIHCDAAYAGAALVLPEHHSGLSAQMAHVDSFDVNMHKWLLTNFDASCLYVRKRRDLIDALSVTPAYLRNQFTESGAVTDYRDWQIPLGRRFRALKIWFVIRTWGVEGLREHIRHHLKLGELFVSLVQSRSDLLGFLAQPRFALSVLTINPRRKERSEPLSEQEQGSSSLVLGSRPSQEELLATNQMTKDVMKVINERKKFFLTATVVDGVDAIRVVASNPLAEEKYIREVFEHIVEITEEVFASKGL